MKKLLWMINPAVNEQKKANESIQVSESSTMNKSADIMVVVQRSTDSASTPSDKQFEAWARCALTGKRDQAEVVIRLVDREEARQFNLQYRHRDYATNVLSFPAELPEGIPADVAGSVLGDLLICAPVVAEEAKNQGKQEVEHWAHLSIHGILHLLGYDHEEEADAAIMEALEIEILKVLGIPDPYSSN